MKLNIFYIWLIGHCFVFCEMLFMSFDPIFFWIYYIMYFHIYCLWVLIFCYLFFCQLIIIVANMFTQFVARHFTLLVSGGFSFVVLFLINRSS